MGGEELLDLGRLDKESAQPQRVAGATDVDERAGLSENESEVAGAKPAIGGECLPDGGFVAEVSTHHVVTPELKLADDLWGALLAGLWLDGSHQDLLGDDPAATAPPPFELELARPHRRQGEQLRRSVHTADARAELTVGPLHDLTRSAGEIGDSTAAKPRQRRPRSSVRSRPGIHQPAEHVIAANGMGDPVSLHVGEHDLGPEHRLEQARAANAQ